VPVEGEPSDDANCRTARHALLPENAVRALGQVPAFIPCLCFLPRSPLGTAPPGDWAAYGSSQASANADPQIRIGEVDIAGQPPGQSKQRETDRRQDRHRAKAVYQDLPIANAASPRDLVVHQARLPK